MILDNIMKVTKQTKPVKTDTVPRLVRFPKTDDEWLEKKAKELADVRGKATPQDCVREIVRKAREMESTA